MNVTVLSSYVRQDSPETPDPPGWFPLVAQKYAVDSFSAHNVPQDFTPNVAMVEVCCCPESLNQILADPDFYVVEVP